MTDKNYAVVFQDGYILVKFSDQAVVTYDDVIGAFDEKTVSEEYRTGNVNSLWDFRTCKPDKAMNYKSVMDLVSYMKSHHAPDEDKRRAGILVDNPLAYGTLRMFQILGQDLPFFVNVFWKEEEAVRWVQG